MSDLIATEQKLACVLWVGIAPSQKPANSCLPRKVRRALAISGGFQLTPEIRVGTVLGVDLSAVGFGVEVFRTNEPPDEDVYAAAKERAQTEVLPLLRRMFQDWGITADPQVYEVGTVEPEQVVG